MGRASVRSCCWVYHDNLYLSLLDAIHVTFSDAHPRHGVALTRWRAALVTLAAVELRYRARLCDNHTSHYIVRIMEK